ncbi:hypothetical protein AGMMS49938_02740 [Fibrobacterales bacterium]|nr:hypothetical protein AGMMS49938_02740 [Fibrobacterales bacterium]
MKKSSLINFTKGALLAATMLACGDGTLNSSKEDEVSSSSSHPNIEGMDWNCAAEYRKEFDILNNCIDWKLVTDDVEYCKMPCIDLPIYDPIEKIGGSLYTNTGKLPDVGTFMKQTYDDGRVVVAQSAIDATDPCREGMASSSAGIYKTTFPTLCAATQGK